MALYLGLYIRSEYYMKNAIVVGIMAGFVCGLVFYVLVNMGLNMEIPLLNPRGDLPTYAPLEFTHGIIWGIIFSSIYAFFYDYIPGKGIKKGLIYGFMLWTIAILRIGALGASHGGAEWALSYTFVNIFTIFIPYSLILGYLYKPPK